ncbi:MAG: Zn-dependent protease with chaperone function [Rhodospirillales bacterium]|nr:Zn-dependent protease with chaperone function [Rhodospirillales bacterium]
MRAFKLSGLFLAALLAAPAWARVPVPDASPQAIAYHQGLDLFWLADQATGLLIPLLFLFTGWSGRLAGWCRRRVGGRWFWTVTLYAMLYTALATLIQLPLTYAENYVYAHAFDQSNQTMAVWVSEVVNGLIVNLVITALIAWIPYLILYRSPRRWWLWTTAALTPVMLVLFILSPIWIAPLFNHFGPMQDKVLEAKVLALAQRGGIQGAPVFEVDASVDSRRLEAYVTGFGPTKRIVLYDTLIGAMDEPEVMFVVGHEMEHYLMGDVWKILVIFIVILLGGMFLVDRGGRVALARWHARFGFCDLADPASLPLLLFGLSFVVLLVTPGLMAFQRSVEHEADRFGLEITRNNEAAARAFVKLGTESLGLPDPGWLERTFRMSHPSLADRITFANDYHPWADGEPLVYGDHIQAP